MKKKSHNILGSVLIIIGLIVFVDFFVDIFTGNVIKGHIISKQTYKKIIKIDGNQFNADNNNRAVVFIEKITVPSVITDQDFNVSVKNTIVLNRDMYLYKNSEWIFMGNNSIRDTNQDMNNLGIFKLYDGYEQPKCFYSPSGLYRLHECENKKNQDIYLTISLANSNFYDENLIDYSKALSNGWELISNNCITNSKNYNNPIEGDIKVCYDYDSLLGYYSSYDEYMDNSNYYNDSKDLYYLVFGIQHGMSINVIEIKAFDDKIEAEEYLNTFTDRRLNRITDSVQLIFLNICFITSIMLIVFGVMLLKPFVNKFGVIKKRKVFFGFVILEIIGSIFIFLI